LGLLLGLGLLNHILPSTARLHPGAHTYCLSAPSNTVLIPILLNNTSPTAIRYSLTHLGSGKVEFVDFSSRDLRAIEQAREEALQLTKTESSADEDDEDDYDPDDVIDDSLPKKIAGSGTSLEKTQSIAHIKVTKPGIVQLQRVYDGASQTDARIAPSEITIAPCPYASFVDDVITKGDNTRCIGTGEELAVKVYGVPPLSLKWHRDVNSGRREQFSVERIEGTNEVSMLVVAVFQLKGSPAALDSGSAGRATHTS
jgi:nucleoporin POM152